MFTTIHILRNLTVDFHNFCASRLQSKCTFIRNLLIASSVYLIWDSTKAAFHQSQHEIIYTYLTLALKAAYKLTRCIKAVILTPVSSRPLSSDWPTSSGLQRGST